MCKIDQLINQLCSNDIKYKTVGDLCRSLPKGTLSKKELTTDGRYPVMNSGRSFYGRFNSFNNEAGAITIASRGEYAGYVNYINERFWAGGLCYPYTSIDERLYITKYIYYCLKNKEKHIMDTLIARGSIPALNKADIDKFVIPIPPLEVQREIVRILDNFMDLTTELTEELTSRKKQYEYYKSTLLSDEYLGANCDGVRKMRVDEICNISRGVVISKDFIRDNPGDYPVYSSQTENDGVLGKINSYSHDGEYITWTTDGANAGTVFRRIGKFNITNVCGLLRLHREDVLLDYLYYALSIQAKKYVSSGMGNPKLMSNVMSRIVVSVPSIDLQKRIVSSLNRFDGVCYDVEKGIPAEIGARRKQYEFYRDKLLAFDELKAA